MVLSSYFCIYINIPLYSGNSAVKILFPWLPLPLALVVSFIICEDSSDMSFGSKTKNWSIFQDPYKAYSTGFVHLGRWREECNEKSKEEGVFPI